MEAGQVKVWGGTSVFPTPTWTGRSHFPTKTDIIHPLAVRVIQMVIISHSLVASSAMSKVQVVQSAIFQYITSFNP